MIVCAHVTTFGFDRCRTLECHTVVNTTSSSVPDTFCRIFANKKVGVARFGCGSVSLFQEVFQKEEKIAEASAIEWNDMDDVNRLDGLHS